MELRLEIHPGRLTWNLENLVYHFSRQLWLVLGVKLMEINSNLFSGNLQITHLETKMIFSPNLQGIMFQPLIFMYSFNPSKVTKMVARNVSIGRKIHKGNLVL